MIDKGVRDASTDYSTKLNEKETAVAKATESAAKAQADAAKASQAAEVLASELKDLKDKMKASEAEAKFHSRMAELDAEYDMSDEDKSCVASDIKGLADDDSFAAYKKKFSVIASEKSKVNKAKHKALQDAKDAELEALKKQKENKSEAAIAADKAAQDKIEAEKAEAAAKALDDAKLLDEKNKITAGLAFDKDSLIKTYKSAFAVEKVTKTK
jgi:hypothetical protein